MTLLFSTFAQSAGKNPEKTALIDHHTGQQYSYQELLHIVKTLAARFRATAQVKPGDRVALLMANHPAFITCFYALQAVGAVVIPLNTRLSPSELSTILNDAGATGLVASPEFGETIDTFTSPLDWLLLTDPTSALPVPAGRPFLLSDWLETPLTDSFVPTQNGPHDLAGLIYTSGTTGTPKGVMLSGNNLLKAAEANAMVIEAYPEDVFITVSPMFHVCGLTNIMLTGLLVGGTIVLIRRFSPRTVLDAIGVYGVTFLAAVPTMYQMMLPLLEGDAYSLDSLRVCHSGAAPMHVAVFEQVERLFGAPVQEGYGQSEASSIVTSNPLGGVRKPGSIGLPLHGLTIEIVDENDTPVPPGEVGELRVQGDTVMLGYWQRPDATAKALRNGWLYTSDLGYRDADGYIFLAGRRDDLINVGGSKVYPQEVEEVLYRHPAVQSCAVTAEPSALYHQVVAAYVVLDSSAGQVLPNELQKFCRAALAEFKVPKSVYFVPEIPKGPTGKILRPRLKDLRPTSSETV